MIENAAHLAQFRPGEVLVADTTTPDWEPVMKTAAAIVTNRGGRTCHAAIIARELGIPAVVGAGDATDGGTGRRQSSPSPAPEGTPGSSTGVRSAFTWTGTRSAIWPARSRRS